MNKKYELTNETIEYNGVTLYRIKALRDFSYVSKGDLGGFVESENNLSHEGECWIFDDGKVFGNGKVIENGMVYGYGMIYDHGTVSGDGEVSEYGEVSGYGRVFDRGTVVNYGKVLDDGAVFDWGRVDDHGKVTENGKVYGQAMIFDYGEVSGNAEICGHVLIQGEAVVKSEKDYLIFKNNWSNFGYFTWTKSNNMWSVECFYGTGEELIKKAYADSEESGRKYESYVKLVEDNFL